MHCKHNFKNTTRFFCVIPHLRNHVRYFQKRIYSNLFFIKLIRTRKITQIVINMPNNCFHNVFTLFSNTCR